jgi:hypothetical protein
VPDDHDRGYYAGRFAGEPVRPPTPEERARELVLAYFRDLVALIADTIRGEVGMAEQRTKGGAS